MFKRLASHCCTFSCIYYKAYANAVFSRCFPSLLASECSFYLLNCDVRHISKYRVNSWQWQFIWVVKNPVKIFHYLLISFLFYVTSPSGFLCFLIPSLLSAVLMLVSKIIVSFHFLNVEFNYIISTDFIVSIWRYFHVPTLLHKLMSLMKLFLSILPLTSGAVSFIIPLNCFDLVKIFFVSEKWITVLDVKDKLCRLPSQIR